MTMAPAPPACWASPTPTPRARPRASGPSAASSFLWNGGEEKGLWGSQYFTEFPPIDLTQSGGRPEHGHDRPHQESEFGGSQPAARAGQSGRGAADRPEHQQRRSGEHHRHRQRQLPEAEDQPFLRRDRSGCHARQPGPATQRPAHFLPQRPLQFRQDGNPDRVLHHRAARGLSPSHGHAGEDRLQGDAADREDRGRGGLGTGERAGTARS